MAMPVRAKPEITCAIPETLGVEAWGPWHIIITAGDPFDSPGRGSSGAGKPTPVANIAAAVLDDKIIVPGGSTSNGAPTNVVEVYVKQLRQKLEAAGGSRLIHTLRGAGYILRED